MKKQTLPLLLLSLLLLFSCKAEEEYSTWPCRFGYDNMVHADATLASAMDNNSRGVFCKISETVRGGVKYLCFENNQGLKSDPIPETAEEKEAKYILGLNNGIIVGFQTLILDPNGGFIGYDVQCPNCVQRENNTINPNYPISMSTSGIATCGKCKRKYDLNNGGILIENGEEGDTGLEKYVAATAGPYSHISVFRK